MSVPNAYCYNVTYGSCELLTVV